MSSDDPATRIQDAATRLFAEKGFDGASVRDIAQRAGVTVGSINYYFGSKEALYRECGRRLTQKYLDEARARLETEGPRAVLEHYVDYAVRDPRLIQIWLDLQGDTSSEGEKRGFSNREILHPIRDFLIEALAKQGAGDVTPERSLKMLCFVGAVILRSMLSEEQFTLLIGTTPEEGQEIWKRVLFENLIDN